MQHVKAALVSRNLLDGVFLGLPAKSRQSGAALCQDCGYDPRHPHAFYDTSVAYCVMSSLGQLLNPTSSVEQQQYALGKVALEGYSLTVPGQMVMAHRPQPAGELVVYYLARLGRELNGMVTKVSEVKEQGCCAEVKDFPLHPSFLSGELAALLQIEERGCQYQIVNPGHYCYTLCWLDQQQ